MVKLKPKFLLRFGSVFVYWLASRIATLICKRGWFEIVGCLLLFINGLQMLQARGVSQNIMQVQSSDATASMQVEGFELLTVVENGSDCILSCKETAAEVNFLESWVEIDDVCNLVITGQCVVRQVIHSQP